MVKINCGDRCYRCLEISLDAEYQATVLSIQVDEATRRWPLVDTVLDKVKEENDE
jgi:hypothetical protein